MKIPVSFTLFTSTSGSLSKTYSRINNKIEKTPLVQMYRGTAERRTMPFKDFADALSNATSEQAFGYGLYLKKYKDTVTIDVSGNEQPEEGILSRTKKYFKYRMELHV